MLPVQTTLTVIVPNSKFNVPVAKTTKIIIVTTPSSIIPIKYLEYFVSLDLSVKCLMVKLWSSAYFFVVWLYLFYIMYSCY